MTTVFQSFVVRASFLSQDRADLGEAAKGLARRVITVFDLRAAENASQHLCVSRH